MLRCRADAGGVLLYNEAAKRVMEESGIAIDDPYAFALPRCRDAFAVAYGLIPGETRRPARFRALHHTLAVLDYAHAAGDAGLTRKSLQAMAHLAEGE